ncbi:ribosome recycling factor [Artomyces pyxidatus]|uniref:Ribosome recycling factor n=1 Tax=Artomyces pyxidatus TaxID=48021 RepID=A0ACB8SJH1_9AGAM|nr:ribosome recycling factor [Artomyces pyxidatus]
MSLISSIRLPLSSPTRPHLLRSPIRRTAPPTVVLPTLRTYASKSKQKSPAAAAPSPTSKRGPLTTSSLTPGSKQALSDPAALAEHARAAAKMAAAVEYFRREAAQLDARASGRVTPHLLAPVRVALPGGEGEDGEVGGETRVRLEEVATVGVRDGSMLVVTVFETDNLKRVEDALYDAKLPNIVPQRVDERTLKIPIPKPTVDARLAVYGTATRQAEETRVQIRRQHQASVKKGKYAKHSVELDEFQKLHDRYMADIETILAQIKKSTGAK